MDNNRTEEKVQSSGDTLLETAEEEKGRLFMEAIATRAVAFKKGRYDRILFPLDSSVDELNFAFAIICNTVALVHHIPLYATRAVGRRIPWIGQEPHIKKISLFRYFLMSLRRKTLIYKFFQPDGSVDISRPPMFSGFDPMEIRTAIRALYNKDILESLQRGE